MSSKLFKLYFHIHYLSLYRCGFQLSLICSREFHKDQLWCHLQVVKHCAAFYGPQEQTRDLESNNVLFNLSCAVV